MELVPFSCLSPTSGFHVMHFRMCVGQTTSALLVPVHVLTRFVGICNFLSTVSNRSEVVGLSGRHMGLLLRWCSVYAAGHLLSCTGTYMPICIIIHYILHNSITVTRVHVFRGRSHRCVSWLYSTSGISSPSTWNWTRLCLDPEPEFLLL